MFNYEGTSTPSIENVLKFLEQYQIEFRCTEALCKKLRELNLLEPIRAQFNLGSGEQLALTGFISALTFQ